MLENLDLEALNFLAHDWQLWARDDQLPPPGDWTTWLLLGGRGSGKTRAGAEWVRMLATASGPGKAVAHQRIALIAETMADARDVMVEGESGLLAIHAEHERPDYIASRRRLEWKNGSVATLFSAEDPDSLRGHQFTAAWCDELAKWRYPQASWDMLQFALRLGPRPRQMVTTTPRPIALLKDLLTRDGVITDRASTHCNRSNLAPAFFDAIIRRYEGTRLGRQEMQAEMLEDNPDALWRREALERIIRQGHPPLERIVLALDPPVSRGAGADACGIIVAGLSADAMAYVLEDATVQGLRPRDWAAHAVRIYHKYGADCLIAEVNQGGEMVRDVLNQIDETISYRPVHARRGKWLRAEPVAMLYEQGWVRHLGSMPELEDEMCAFTPAGRANGHSPDRLDALVWALSELKLARSADPHVRTI